MNSLPPEGSVEMAGVWDEFAADDEAWVAVVTGEGDRAFSTGFDLKSAARKSASPEPDRPAFPSIPMGFGGLTSRLDLFKPVIARVNGYALGGGMELALACDIFFVADHARFCLPRVKEGLTAAAGRPLRPPPPLALEGAAG